MGYAFHAADALVEIDGRRDRSGTLGDGALLAGERTRVAGEAVEAVGNHETAFAHAGGRRFAGLVEQALRALLGVDVFLGNRQVSIVIDPAAEGLLDFVSALAAAEHRGGTFADPHGVADAVAGQSEDLVALAQQLAVGQQAGADVDAVDAVDPDLGARDRLEVLALGDDGAGYAGPVFIRDGLDKRIGSHDRNAEAAEPVGLHGEASLVGHGLDDGLDLGACLHGLIGSQVSDVAGAYGEDAFAQEGELLVHHPLHDGGGEYARQVVVLEGRHKGEGARRDDELFCIDVEDFLRHDVLDRQPLSFQDIPHDTVEHDPFQGVAGQGLGNVESAHATELLLFFEEEELVGLHLELPADGVVVVDHEVVDACLVQLFADGQAGWPGTDDGHGRTIDLLLAVLPGGAAVNQGETLLSDAADFPDAIDLGDADTADVAVHQHFAGTALADTALHGAFAVFQAMVVNRESGLVQRGGDGLAFLATDFLTFKDKFMEILLRDVQNRVGCYFVHKWFLLANLNKVMKITVSLC